MNFCTDCVIWLPVFVYYKYVMLTSPGMVTAEATQHVCHVCSDLISDDCSELVHNKTAKDQINYLDIDQ